MKKYHYPYIALVVGVMLMLMVMKGSQVGEDGITLIPLLTLLAMSEVAFFATAVGVFVGIKHTRATGMNIPYVVATAICALLAARFMWLGLELWPL